MLNLPFLDTALAAVSEILRAYPMLRDMTRAVVWLLVFFAVIACCERMSGACLSRYRSKNFRTDVTYALFYMGGIYNAWVYLPVIALVAPLVPDWRLNLIERLPPIAGFVIYWVISDFIAYWIHRWQHSSTLLWRLHRVHHSQTQMTFATSFRNHVLEQLYVNLLLYVPLMVLGLPIWYWAPVFLMQQFLEAIQHADLRWKYGWLYPVVVGPVFHAVHHAKDRAHHDSNYGKTFGIWDLAFGTLSPAQRPAAFGIEGKQLKESLLGTVLMPFRR